MNSQVMNSYSGKIFDPMQISAQDICLEDIAHSLAMMCRGSGQLLYFYSVAQHSLNCAYEAMARGYDLPSILACLLHDASEGYIADIIRPVKQHLQEYYVIEDMIMSAIFQKYDLLNVKHQLWQDIDNDMLENEMTVMLSHHQSSHVPPLKSKPDFSERNYREVEHEFLFLARQLLKERDNDRTDHE